MIVWDSGNCIRQRNIQFGCSPGSSSLLFCVNMKVMMIWDFVERWLLTLNTQVITSMALFIVLFSNFCCRWDHFSVLYYTWIREIVIVAWSDLVSSKLTRWRRLGSSRGCFLFFGNCGWLPHVGRFLCQHCPIQTRNQFLTRDPVAKYIPWDSEWLVVVIETIKSIFVPEKALIEDDDDDK
jgi:hypothetical protein